MERVSSEEIQKRIEFILVLLQFYIHPGQADKYTPDHDRNRPMEVQFPLWPDIIFQLVRYEYKLSVTPQTSFSPECITPRYMKSCTYTRSNGSVLKIFDQFICSNLPVPLINPSRDSPNFEKFIKMFLFIDHIDQNAHE